MAWDVLATTAGVAVLMAVLPRALFALRLGRTEGLTAATALGLMLGAGLLAVYGASVASLTAFVANVAAAATCAAFLVLSERCQHIQAERSAIAARMRAVRPTRRARVRS
jgi:hypothetical protein